MIGIFSLSLNPDGPNEGAALQEPNKTMLVVLDALGCLLFSLLSMNYIVMAYKVLAWWY